MKIAVYSHSFAPSIDGVCRRFTAIVHELKRQGHDVFVFTLESEPQGLEGIRYYTLNFEYIAAYPGKKVGQPSFHNFMVIYNALKHEKPDVLHATTDSMSFFFAAPCTMLGIPCVASFHTDLQLLGKAVNTVWIALWAAYYKEQVDTVLYDSCATTSPSFQKKLEKQGVPCEYVLGTAVDVEMFHPSKFSLEKRSELTKGDTDGLLCVFVGRLSPEKKIGFMYEVLKQVDNAYFAVIGDGLEAEKWAAEADVPGSRMYCKPGFLTHDELAVVYASADLHVSASEFETLGNTVLESHACGTPVVVTNAQGFCNTVEHGVDGYLFKAGDAEDAIAYLTELRDNRTKLREMGERGRQKMVEQHTVQAVVADMVTWYEKGIDNFANKSTARLMLACFHMVWAIALNIVLFFGYQAATGVLEQLGVISPKKDPHFHMKKQQQEQQALLEAEAAADAKEPILQKKANGSTTKQPRSRRSKH